MILGSTYLRHHCAKCRRTLTDCLIGTKTIQSVDVDFDRDPDDVCRSFRLGEYIIILCKGCALFFEKALEDFYIRFLEEQFGGVWHRDRGKVRKEGTSAAPSQARDSVPDPDSAEAPRKDHC